jgi:RNA polymerase sigma factor (sigma-70 family)
VAFSKSKPLDSSITDEEYRELFDLCYKKASFEVFYADQFLIKNVARRAIQIALTRPNWRELYLEKKYIRRLVVDAVRVELGNYRTPKHRVREVPLDHDDRPEDSITPPKVTFSEMLKDVPHREHAIMHLKFIWGMEHKEIAEIFRVDEARISQLINETIKRLRDQDV